MKLGELYTELNVKDAGFRRSMNSARANLRKTGAGFNRMARRGMVAFAKLRAGAVRFAAGVRAAGAAIVGFISKIKMFALVAAAGVGLLLKKYADQEAAERRLAAALDTTGQSAEKHAARLREVAAAIQRETVYGDEATMSVMALGINMGIAAEQTEEATKQALGLAAAYGMDVKMAMRGVALARQGEFTLLNRYIPALRLAADEQEKMAAFTAAAAAGYRQAKDDADTFSGSMKQLWNVIGDLAEELGMALVPMARELAAGLKDIIPKIRAWVSENLDLLETFGKFVASEILDTLKKFGELVGLIFRVMSDNKDVIKDLLDWVHKLNSAIRSALTYWGKLTEAYDKIAGSADKVGDAHERLARRMRMVYRMKLALAAASGALPGQAASAGASTGRGMPYSSPGGMHGQGHGRALTPLEWGAREAAKKLAELDMTEQFAIPAGRAKTPESRSGGFTGIAQLARTIQQNVFQREEERRQKRMLQVSEKQLKTLDHIHNALKEKGMGLAIT